MGVAGSGRHVDPNKESCVTEANVAMECRFLYDPSESLKCCICSGVAKDPKQEEECGKLFCSDCIEHMKDNCPTCWTANPKFFIDKKSYLEIQVLEVYCDYLENGCDWVGTVKTLEKHKAQCGFAKVPCPNYCQEEEMLRLELDYHLSSECIYREYSCDHCGMKDKFVFICAVHDDECEKKVISCSNEGCSVLIERGKLASHLRESCDYTEVYCKYASISCEEKRLRKNMKQHEDNSELHLTMVLDKIVELNKFTLSPEKKQRSITFKLNGFSLKTGRHHFQPFFTSPSGYKISFDVYPGGYGDGEGTHLSLYIKVLHGPYDDTLEWPLKANFTIELLNQLADCNHYERTVHFDEDEDYCNPGGRGYGYQRFIPLSKLSCDEVKNTHYLKDDVLYFRMTPNIIHQKPWLDHTHT